MRIRRCQNEKRFTQAPSRPGKKRRSTNVEWTGRQHAYLAFLDHERREPRHDHGPTITQAMIDAYDEYTHLTLDRRGFMDKLTRLAGSGAAAAAIAPLLAANSASAAIVPEDDQRLKAEDITWPADGGEMKGYLVQPAGPDRQAAGTSSSSTRTAASTPISSDVARRVALEGFVALGAGFPVAARRHARRRGQGARDVQRARCGEDGGAMAWRRSPS